MEDVVGSVMVSRHRLQQRQAERRREGQSLGRGAQPQAARAKLSGLPVSSPQAQGSANAQALTKVCGAPGGKLEGGGGTV